MNETVPINNQIRVNELRVLTEEGENLGVLPLVEALKEAEGRKLDLILISPKANPPVAKIMDYGRFQYGEKKKLKEQKAKAHVTETKSVQMKIGTGEHDLELKARRVSEWLSEGNRVKIDLFLWGRYKYMEFSFLKERLVRFLHLVSTEYKIADEIKKSPKGLTVVIERAGKYENK